MISAPVLWPGAAMTASSAMRSLSPTPNMGQIRFQMAGNRFVMESSGAKVFTADACLLAESDRYWDICHGIKTAYRDLWAYHNAI